MADDARYAERARAFQNLVKDVSEFLAAIDLVPPTQPVPLRVTYQDACHLVHGQGIRQQPRKLLRQIPGLELVEMNFSDVCCGSAGIYNLTHPDVAAELQRQKVAAILDARPDLVVSANPGCILQVAAGLRAAGSEVPVVHLMRFLDDPSASLGASEVS